jgi:antitoxin (DNA-binding transcriptional repressor) of toxin-antitoxin stability system
VIVTNRGQPVAVISPAEGTRGDRTLRPADEAWRDIEAALAAVAPEFPTWQQAMRHARRRP